MWLTVLVLALVATADPVRIGVSVVLSSRPTGSRWAVGPLVAFWLGGMAISVVLTIGVLFGLRDFALTTMHRVQLATATSTAGHLQIAIGAVALLVAATAAGLSPRQRARLAMPVAPPQPMRAPSTISRLSTRVHDALQARPLGVSFILGVAMLVDFRFLAALTAIVASGVAVGTQIGAAGMYTLVALSFIELPLVSQLAAPAKTDRVMAVVNQWAKARRQQVFAVVIGLLGAFLISRGLGHI
ncbi:hypothetical protein A5634_07025 [Mycobacterium asiaticum]|uniref:GAP family protein n=1 Tax=Mycobacterium asiaticum TaxID=1790 RepID=A0A1A3NMZ9_MYCAS|nr:GAP family protein [Mycobacterium asiaticum]OBK22720.1 hypothetical protein A5634_07025 [Mycobacterium asiaticum]